MTAGVYWRPSKGFSGAIPMVCGGSGGGCGRAGGGADAYQRLRAALAPASQPVLTAGEPGPATDPQAERPVPPAAAFATYDPPPAASAPRPDDDTAELRLRIDETRDRIRRRVQDAPEDEPA